MKEKVSENKDNTRPPVMDVSHPGTSSPSATSRPIITGSGKMLRDPMVRDDNTNDEAVSNEQEEIKSPATSNKVVQPLHAETEKEDGTTSQPEEEKEVESDDTEKTTATSSHDGSESAIINAVIDSSSKDKNTTKQVVSDEDEQIAELIRSKKYFVHVSNAHESRLIAYSTIIVLIFGIVLFFYYADTQGWITFSL